MVNELSMKYGALNTFELEIRGRNAATQMMAKKVMGKLIKEKLEKKGVIANVKCERREVEVDVEQERGRVPAINNKNKADSPLAEEDEVVNKC